MWAVLSPMVIDVNDAHSANANVNSERARVSQRADSPSQCLMVAIVSQPKPVPAAYAFHAPVNAIDWLIILSNDAVKDDVRRARIYLDVMKSGNRFHDVPSSLRASSRTLSRLPL